MNKLANYQIFIEDYNTEKMRTLFIFGCEALLHAMIANGHTSKIIVIAYRKLHQAG